MGRFFRLAAIAVIVATASVAAQAHERSIRCGNALIQTGDPVSKLMRECGEPYMRERVENRFGASVGTRYYFEMPQGQADRTVLVNEGRVQSIEVMR